MLRDAYAELGQLQVATATGGNTTTVVDTKLAGMGQDDDWKGGAVIVLQDAGGAGAAPEGGNTEIRKFLIRIVDPGDE
jgi:hypothetical protein